MSGLSDEHLALLNRMEATVRRKNAATLEFESARYDVREALFAYLDAVMPLAPGMAYDRPEVTADGTVRVDIMPYSTLIRRRERSEAKRKLRSKRG